MIRTLLLSVAIVLGAFTHAQTFFYIDQIAVNPQPATTADNISIDLIGGLSSTGASVTSASAQVTGNIVTISITAQDLGGFTVIVPHTETIQLGQLPAGTYTIVINGTFVGDFAPAPQHEFVVLGGGSPCDNLGIVSVQWHAFTDTAIVVRVTNSNPNEIFDYPNFILFDTNGDTLAVETVNFFGIGDESMHLLAIHPDATMPVGPFSGTLQLWSLFTTELACEWSLNIDLCPPEPCATIIPNMQNLGGALVIGDFNYSIFDENMDLAASGTLTMLSDTQFDADTLCLPPGQYSMACIPLQPSTGGGPYFSVMAPGWIAGPGLFIFEGLPVLTPFTFYEPCIDGTNSIPDTRWPGFSIQQHGDVLRVLSGNGSSLGPIELFDAQGRLLTSTLAAGESADLNLSGIGAGVVLVRAGGQSLRWVVLR